MRKFLFLLLVSSSFLFACNNSASSPQTTASAPEEDSVESTPTAASLAPEFLQKLAAQDSGFRADNFEEGELTGEFGQELPIDPDHLKPFLPYLIYNADSSLAIDRVSYNYIPVQSQGSVKLEEGGPDFEVSLIDFPKKVRKRLLFLGTMGTVMSARWFNDHTIVLAGATEMKSDSIRPAIWKIDNTSGRRELYEYPRFVRTDLHNLTPAF